MIFLGSLAFAASVGEESRWGPEGGEKSLAQATDERLFFAICGRRIPDEQRWPTELGVRMGCTGQRRFCVSPGTEQEALEQTPVNPGGEERHNRSEFL